MKTSLAWPVARPLAICLCLAALVWVVFGQTLSHDFVNYDDPSYVYENPRITSGLTLASAAWAFTHVHGQNWHPLTTISHMLDGTFYGMRAGGHHFTNVLLHTAGSVLLFCALRALTGATWRSAIVAALFAVHPLRVESVAWIAERKDVLSGVFFMLTLLSYARYARRPSFGSYAVVAGCLAMGLMSKPMLVTLPAVLLLLDYWPLRRFRTATSEGGNAAQRRAVALRLIIEKLPLFLLVVGACAATLLAQGQYIGVGENLPWWWRINNAAISYVTYARQMFWPAGLVPFYPHPENTVSALTLGSAIVALIIVSALALLQRRQRPYLLVGWLWYLGMLVPVIGLVQVGWQGHADRYTYLPEIGLAIAIVWGAAELLSRWRAGRLAGGVCAGLVTAGLTSAAWKQTSYWRNSETLWTRTLAVMPNNDVAQNNLGVVLMAHGDKDGAVARYREALRLRPDNVPAHISLANVLLHDGKMTEGVSHLERVLELEPANSEARNLLGVVLLQEGDVRAALREWEKTIEFDPANGNARNNLAWVYATNPDSAVRDGQKAVTLAREAAEIAGGRNALVWRTLAAADAEAGQFDQALEVAKKARAQAAADNNSALVSELDATVSLYRAHQALRDPSQPGVSR
ncbi:MAG: tetratricopeptide repeat protein [Verrucomicrobiota bacterium]|nr:tetratricopeptide repeat protein [Verrucomicrobiota bacterium]